MMKTYDRWKEATRLDAEKNMATSRSNGDSNFRGGGVVYRSLLTKRRHYRKVKYEHNSKIVTVEQLTRYHGKGCLYC